MSETARNSAWDALNRMPDDADTNTVNIPLDELHAYPNHPFQVRNDIYMMELAQSIKENGVINPIIVRSRDGGGYEIIAGHRRKRACEIAELTEIPCVVRDLTDEDAAVLMVDTNIQREDILPSERARAYKIRDDAMEKRPGKRTDISTSLQSETRLKKDEVPDNKTRVWRYLRLNYLTEELLEMVDNKNLALISAVNISFADAENQRTIQSIIAKKKISVTTAQSKEIKRRSDDGTLNEDAIKCILLLDKPKVTTISIKSTELDSLIPSEYNAQQKKDYVLEALTYYAEHRQKDGE